MDRLTRLIALAREAERLADEVVRLKMRPALPAQNLADRVPRDAERGSNLPLLLARSTTRANLEDLDGVELLEPPRVVPPLTDGLVEVLGAGPDRQVRGIDAHRVVAGVHDLQPLGDRPAVGEPPRDAVGVLSLAAADVDLSVPHAADVAALELPAVRPYNRSCGHALRHGVPQVPPARQAGSLTSCVSQNRTQSLNQPRGPIISYQSLYVMFGIREITFGRSIHFGTILTHATPIKISNGTPVWLEIAFARCGRVV